MSLIEANIENLILIYSRFQSGKSQVSLKRYTEADKWSTLLFNVANIGTVGGFCLSTIALITIQVIYFRIVGHVIVPTELYQPYKVW